MASVKLFGRVGRWFRRTNSPVRSLDAGATQDGNPPAAGTGLDPEPGRLVTADAPAALGKIKLPRSSVALDRLEKEYTRVTMLMDSMQDHMATQSERSQQVVQLLGRTADVLESLGDNSLRQTELLSSLKELGEAQNATAERTEQSFSQLPQLADAQRETMVSIGRQLEYAKTSSEEMVGGVKDVRQALEQLGNVTDHSTKTLEKIQSDAAAREERVAEILREQTRRLTIFAAVAVGLAGVAAVTAMIALLR